MMRFIRRLWATGINIPAWLRLCLFAGLAAIAVFGFSVSNAVSRHTEAVQTLARDATSGITAAQRIKSALEEMNVNIQQALTTTGSDEQKYLNEYRLSRVAVNGAILDASEHVAFGLAQEAPIKHITQVLPYYHKSVMDAVDAHDRRAETMALANYRKAADLLRQNLLPDADNLDKANTYALNQSYARQKTTSVTTESLLLTTSIALLALLVIVQIFFLARFHRLINIWLLCATLLGGGFFVYSLNRLHVADSSLVSAKDDSFDNIHVLWRTRAAALAARQFELDQVLDPTHVQDHRSEFDLAARRVINYSAGDMPLKVVPESALAESELPDEVGGYLAFVLRNVEEGAEHSSTVEAVSAWNGYLLAVNTPKSSAAFGDVLNKIDAARQLQQQEFDRSAGMAISAISGLFLADLGVAAALILFLFLGINSRLKEYAIAIG